MDAVGLKISLANKGKKKPPRTLEHRRHMSETHKQRGIKPPSRLGWHHSEETKKQIKEHSAHFWRGKHNPHVSGANNSNWKGGITPLNAKLRNSLEYKLWRTAVFERDNYKCIWCGTGGDLHADHIKPFSKYPELRLAIDNGRTLCVRCHQTTDTYLNNFHKKVECLPRTKPK